MKGFFASPGWLPYFSRQHVGCQDRSARTKGSYKSINSDDCEVDLSGSAISHRAKILQRVEKNTLRNGKLAVGSCGVDGSSKADCR